MLLWRCFHCLWKNFPVKHRYFDQLQAQAFSQMCSLNCCNGSVLKTGCSSLQIRFAVIPINLYLFPYNVAGQQGQYFHHHQLGHRFLLISPHLYVTFSLSPHNALNHLICFDVHILSSCATYKWEKETGVDTKLSYLPTTARLCSEPHAIWKRIMNGSEKISLPVPRQPQLGQEIKN